MYLATRSAKGMPFVTPLWFVPHRGLIWATTAASSWAARNVTAVSEVAVLLGGEGERQPDRILVRGHASAVLGMPPPPVLARYAWRYFLEPRFARVEMSHASLWRRRARYYAQAQAAYLVIAPQFSTAISAPAH